MNRRIIKCPVCKGTGKIRFEWNASIEGAWDRTLVPHYADRWCKRCRGKGITKIKSLSE